MNPLKYIHNKGLKQTLQVFYKYKIDLIIYKIYHFFFNHKPLKDIIILESHNDFDCNGGALYDFFINNGVNNSYKIVWLLKHDAPECFPYNVEAFNLFRPSIKKNVLIHSAKYLFADNNVVTTLRSGQISVYCTHGGCTIKNVKGFLTVPNQVTYILSPSKKYDPFECENYSIEYPNNKMLHLGFPANDALFENHCNELKKVTNKNFNKVVLWMPTFRKLDKSDRNDSLNNLPLGVPIFSDNYEVERFNDFLLQMDMLLIIKIHPMQDKSSTQIVRGLSNIAVLDGDSVKKLGINNYKLMSCCDALLSDYSSSAYSFLLLNRPIGFVLSDLESYLPGFSVENPEFFMPGKKIYNLDDFKKFLFDLENGCDLYHVAREKLCKWLYEYKDGNSCARIARYFNLV